MTAKGRRPWLFPPSRAPRLESKDRQSLLPWERIAQALRPGPGLSYGDLGAGPGVFTHKLLAVTRGEGRFFAVEAQESMLNLLRARREAWLREGWPGASRVEILEAPPGKPEIPLPSASLDRALLIHLLHEIGDISAYLRDLRRVLRPWGRALIIDWASPRDPGRAGLSGPPLWSRLSEKEAAEEAVRAGFKNFDSLGGFPHGWALLLA